MICSKCSSQAIENEAGGYMFWYCRQCKTEVTEQEKPTSISPGAALDMAYESGLTPVEIADLEQQLIDIYRSMTVTGGL